MNWRWLLKVVISASLLGWLLGRSDVQAVMDRLTSLDQATVALAVFLYLVGVVLAAVKWRLLVPTHSVGLLSALTLVGQFYSIVLPGQIAGEVMKAYRLGKGRQDAERLAASVALDKATGLTALLLLGLLGLALTELLLPPALKAMMTIALGAGLAAAGALAVPFVYGTSRRALELMGSALPRLTGAAARVAFFLDAWRKYLSAPGVLTLSIGVGIILQANLVLIIWILGGALGLSVMFIDWLWIFTIVSLAVVLPLSIGGLGIREGAFVGVLGLLAVAPEKALALSLSIFGLQLFGGTLGAVVEIVGVHSNRGARL